MNQAAWCVICLQTRERFRKVGRALVKLVEHEAIQRHSPKETRRQILQFTAEVRPVAPVPLHTGAFRSELELIVPTLKCCLVKRGQADSECGGDVRGKLLGARVELAKIPISFYKSENQDAICSIKIHPFGHDGLQLAELIIGIKQLIDAPLFEKTLLGTFLIPKRCLLDQ